MLLINITPVSKTFHPALNIDKTPLCGESRLYRRQKALVKVSVVLYKLSCVASALDQLTTHHTLHSVCLLIFSLTLTSDIVLIDNCVSVKVPSVVFVRKLWKIL